MDREEEWPQPALSKQDAKRLLEKVADLVRGIDQSHPDEKTQKIYDLVMERMKELE